MKPVKVTYNTQDPLYVAPLEGDSINDLAEHLSINSPATDNLSLAMWNGHEFEVVVMHYDIWEDSSNGQYMRFRGDDHVTLEYAMTLYYPPDPRIKESDVKGATIAYPNETNDGWLFAHCDADFHHDMELKLKAAVVGLFQSEIDALLEAVLITPDGTNAAPRITKWNNMRRLRDLAVDCVIKAARDRPLGYFHQFPHDSHMRKFIQDCFERSLFIHSFTQSQVYLSVQEEAVRVLKDLRTRHAYETRWDYVKRVRDEAARREAAREASSDDEE